MNFEFLEHTADIKIKASGRNIAQGFTAIARAMSHYFNRGNAVAAKKEKKISLQGTDTKNLLYVFIDHIIYLLDAENFLVKDARLVIENNKLEGILYGDDSTAYNHLDHIKAATYSEMEVTDTPSGVEIIAVLDV